MIIFQSSFFLLASDRRKLSIAFHVMKDYVMAKMWKISAQKKQTKLNINVELCPVQKLIFLPISGCNAFLQPSANNRFFLSTSCKQKESKFINFHLASTEQCTDWFWSIYSAFAHGSSRQVAISLCNLMFCSIWEKYIGKVNTLKRQGIKLLTLRKIMLTKGYQGICACVIFFLMDFDDAKYLLSC